MSSTSDIPPQGAPAPREDRRQAAREKAAEIRAEQERRTKRTRLISVVAIIALLLVAVGVAWWVIASAKDEQTPGAQPGAVATATDDVTLSGKEVSDKVSTAERGFGQAAGAISIGPDGEVGKAWELSPVVDLYFDFACPHCYDFEKEFTPSLLEMAKAGEITLVLHPVSILEGGDGFQYYPSRAVDAIFAIAKDDPTHLSEVVEEFFAVWHKYSEGGQQGPMPGSKELADAAAAHGVKDDVVKAIREGSVDRVAKAATAAFGETGARGTPAVMFNGTEIKPEDRGKSGAELAEYIKSQRVQHQ
ncbi:MAG: thioredoxin domain-containing protein [Bowdeniella nasicola]|nr:thioredoxin domain-containing protein [Bowdeniella nasicola]